MHFPKFPTYIRRLLLLALFTAPPLLAEPPALTLDEARAERARASEIKAEAERVFKEDEAACYQRVLVNDCLETAKKKRLKTIREARAIDKVGRDAERQHERLRVEEREAARAADAPRRAAEQRIEGRQYREEVERKAAERDAKIAEKERKAEEGRRRLAAEEAERREKLEARARKDAERESKKAERAPGKEKPGG